MNSPAAAAPGYELEKEHDDKYLLLMLPLVRFVTRYCSLLCSSTFKGPRTRAEEEGDFKDPKVSKSFGAMTRHVDAFEMVLVSILVLIWGDGI